jgi:hypothetical protein
MEAFLNLDFVSRSIYCLILDFPCQKMTLSIKRKMKEVRWEVGRALSTGAVPPEGNVSRIPPSGARLSNGVTWKLNEGRQQ